MEQVTTKVANALWKNSIRGFDNQIKFILEVSRSLRAICEHERTVFFFESTRALTKFVLRATRILDLA